MFIYFVVLAIEASDELFSVVINIFAVVDIFRIFIFTLTKESFYINLLEMAVENLFATKR